MMLYKILQLHKTQEEITDLFVYTNRLFPSESELVRTQKLIEVITTNYPRCWQFLRYTYVSICSYLVIVNSGSFNTFLIARG